MPTENRSSNTDPRDVFIRLNPLGLGEEELRKDTTGFEDPRTHSDYLLFLAGYRELYPEPQPHPEPIAWMVGTAFWWTKEEAERNAAAMGLPVVGLGQMTDRAAIEIAESETMAVMAELAECEAMADMVAEREWAEHVGTGDVSSKVEAAFTQLHNDLHEAGEKLAERDALLKEVLIKTDKWMLPDLYERIRLSFKAANAEPEATS